jgi:hypothetical protein
MKENAMGWACGKRGEKRSTYRVWWGNLKTSRPFGNPWHNWKDNIKMLPEVILRGKYKIFH